MDRYRGLFPSDLPLEYTFEQLATVVRSAFSEIDAEQRNNGNTERFFELSRTWGRRMMGCWKDCLTRYVVHDTRGSVLMGNYHVVVEILPFYNPSGSDRLHFSASVQSTDKKEWHHIEGYQGEGNLWQKSEMKSPEESEEYTVILRNGKIARIELDGTKKSEGRPDLHYDITYWGMPTDEE